MKDKSNRGYAAKHDGAARLDAALARELKGVQTDDGVSCENAHAVAHRLQKAPREAGKALDLMNLRIARCQLGLFGYAPRKRIVKPAATVDADLAAAIRSALVNGRLPCETAWAIATRRRHSRLSVAEACEALGIKITDCQLGAF